MHPIDEPPPTAELIRARYDTLLTRLRAAADAAGRDADAIRVVAVTKGFGARAVLEAFAAGLRRFGENRVQEALPKLEAVPDGEWHLVGRLQANKARAAVRAFSVVHSVDSLDLLARLDRIAAEESRMPRVLLQVNITAEPTKAGFALDDFASGTHRSGPLSDAIQRLTAVELVGLMTIGEAGVPPEKSRSTFATLRRLRDELEQLTGRPLPELSMGMTADAEAAAAEGATLVRVGTAIFGPRPA